MRRTVFTRARWAVAVAAVACIAAMLRYPGGTLLDRSSHGYSLTRNFLSDLGMTVAYNGEANALGAALFVLSLMIMVLGLGGCLVGFVRLLSESPRSRGLARAAGAVGFLVCAAFTGVAVTPENQVMALHLGFTLLAFRALPLVSLLLGAATLASRVFPKRVAIAWFALSVVLIGYVAVLGWGPALATTAGLTVQVIAQKVVTVVAVGTFVYLGMEGDRVLSARILISSLPSRIA